MLRIQLGGTMVIAKY